MAKRNLKHILFAVGIFVLLLLFLLVPEIAADFLWFKAVDFSEIFIINIEAKLFLFFVSGLIFFSFVMINLWIAFKSRKKKDNWISNKTLVLITLLLSFLIGRFSSTMWDVFLKFMRQEPFGITDPIFSHDISFYIFTLPFLEFLRTFAALSVTIALVMVAIYYFQSLIAAFISGSFTPSEELEKAPKNINLRNELGKLKNRAKMHMSVLVALTFLVFAFGHYITRYTILYSSRGAVMGAGYTEVNATLPIINLALLFSVLLAVMSLLAGFVKLSAIRKISKYFISLMVLYLVLSIFGLSIVPSIMQSLVVSPNEFTLEKPYLEHNLNFTREAYGLDNVNEKAIDYDKRVDEEIVRNNQETIDNVRILDWRPLTQTYKQTQEIRLYYDLSGIDIGRYTINDHYTQVMLSPREMNLDQVQDQAKTWVNNHLVFTHGFGVVMSPVNNVTDEGLPQYLLKNIPPVNTVNESNIEIEQPRIYYGEKPDSFVVVNTETKEFDYPKGDNNMYTHYDGSGGIKLDSFFKKLVMAIKFKDTKIMLSSDINEDSRFMFRRNIKDRVKRITPFLALDSDPYMVVDDGKLYWMMDAYTITSKYPYSEGTSGFNYIRNPVKIVVDAYTGKVDYYLINNDPIMATYANMYPGQFKDIEEMPNGLKDHIRYPTDLFKAQAELYTTYHMDNPNVFYNKEDAWEIPYEIYGSGKKVRVEPYYITMKMPGSDILEFILMTSYTPTTKDNMISWLAAKSDGEDYGELSIYKFPKDKVVYGPSQVEATIDQDTEISQQLTLWSQRGSSVIRGNLLVIPLDGSVLYVEPIYLQSEQGQLPQLKRVIVSDGESVVMGNNLQQALNYLFKDNTSSMDTFPQLSNSSNQRLDTFDELIKTANYQYNNFLDGMKEKDWEAIGKSVENLGKTLEELSKR
ncbi:MAG: UPF0182 family protein [Nanobdellota archaeon]